MMKVGSLFGWTFWGLMALLSLNFGFYAVRIWNQDSHRVLTTHNLGERFFDMWFDAYHTSAPSRYWLFVLHVVPSGIVFLLAPTQFIPHIQQNYPALHRWTGRASFVLVLIATIAVFLLQFSTMMGINCVFATFIFGTFTIVSVVKAYRAAKARDFVTHREWAIRMWAMCFGVFWMRIMIVTIKTLVYPADAYLHEASARELFALEFWMGWVVAGMFAEVYIWLTQGAPVVGGRKKVN